jgi:hypothetical protein
MELMNTDAKGLAYIRSAEEFDNARRRAFLEDIVGRLRGHKMDLLNFDEVLTRLRLQQTVALGLRDVPVDQIVGSVGRYTDFTRTFLPRRAGRDKERWRQVYTLATTGQGFPPIELYKVDQVYFVKDGNHRVSVARELKWQTIQAYVIEFPTVFSLKPDMKPFLLLIKEECAYFLEKTRLHELRPAADITYTLPGRYERLLKQIAVHSYCMTRHRGEPPTMEEAVIDWYDSFYQPMIKRLQASGMMKLFPKRTVDDLAAWLIEHQQALRIDHALDEVGYPEDFDRFLAYLDQLSQWQVARAGVGDTLKGLLKQE